MRSRAFIASVAPAILLVAAATVSAGNQPFSSLGGGCADGGCGSGGYFDDGSFGHSAGCGCGCANGLGPSGYWGGPRYERGWHLNCPGPYSPTRWYVDAELLFLYRDSVNTQPDPAVDVPFDGNYETGFLFTLGYQFAPSYRLDVTYFGPYNWGQSQLVGPDPISFGGTLDSVEINMRHRFRMPPNPFEASCLVGARYMKIDEDLAFQGQQQIAQNRLFGIQGGYLLQFYSYRNMWVDWEVKGTIANNDVSVTALGDKDVTSFIGETSVVANCQIFPSLTFRVGYRGLWVTGLALPEENWTNVLIDDSGEMAYHGLNVGLTWSR